MGHNIIMSDKIKNNGNYPLALHSKMVKSQQEEVCVCMHLIPEMHSHPRITNEKEFINTPNYYTKYTVDTEQWHLNCALKCIEPEQTSK